MAYSINAPIRLYSIVGGVVLVGLLGARYWLKRYQITPDQREKMRRDYLNQIGRIIDGTVLDVSEMKESKGGELQLLIYSYDVAGVSYEASQDVTQLRQFVDLHTCRIGLPASIRYDPHNPGNSMVVSEGWSGLRTHGTTKIKALTTDPAIVDKHISG